jgi:cytochrome c-type biogenesis protein CcmH
MSTRHIAIVASNWLATIVIVVSTIVAPGEARAASSPVNASSSAATTDAERALQERLIAPCCWTQTLDAHESEVSTQLRAEIRARLSRGEAPAAIEDDLAARFGERIRAVPKGKDPLRRVPVVVGLAMVASAIGLAFVLRRWTRRREVAPNESERLDGGVDEYDARLDDELRRLHDR